eukprot:s781_g1.t1
MTTRADDRRWWCEPGDDDDAATTSDDDVDSFLWLPFVAAVCSYRLWQLMWLPIWRPMWLPMWLQPPGALTVPATVRPPQPIKQPAERTELARLVVSLQQRGIMPKEDGEAGADARFSDNRFSIGRTMDSNVVVPRLLGILQPLTLEIVNWPGSEDQWLEGPSSASAPSRRIPFSKHLFVEKRDFGTSGAEAGDSEPCFCAGEEVRLRHCYAIRCKTWLFDDAGEVTAIQCECDFDSLGVTGSENKSDGPGPNIVSWVAASCHLHVQVALQPGPADLVAVHGNAVGPILCEPWLAALWPELVHHRGCPTQDGYHGTGADSPTDSSKQSKFGGVVQLERLGEFRICQVGGSFALQCVKTWVPKTPPKPGKRQRVPTAVHEATALASAARKQAMKDAASHFSVEEPLLLMCACDRWERVLALDLREAWCEAAQLEEVGQGLFRLRVKDAALCLAHPARGKSNSPEPPLLREGTFKPDNVWHVAGLRRCLRLFTIPGSQNDLVAKAGKMKLDFPSGWSLEHEGPYQPRYESLAPYAQSCGFLAAQLGRAIAGPLLEAGGPEDRADAAHVVTVQIVGREDLFLLAQDDLGFEAFSPTEFGTSWRARPFPDYSAALEPLAALAMLGLGLRLHQRLWSEAPRAFLDATCGTGTLAAAAKYCQKDWPIFAGDVNPTLARRARINLEAAFPKQTFELTEVSEKPVPGIGVREWDATEPWPIPPTVSSTGRGLLVASNLPWGKNLKCQVEAATLITRCLARSFPDATLCLVAPEEVARNCDGWFRTVFTEPAKDPMAQLKARTAATAAERERVAKERAERVKAGVEEARKKRKMEEVKRQKEEAAERAKKSKADDVLESLYGGLPPPDPEKDQAMAQRVKEQATWKQHRFPPLPVEDPAKVIFLDVDGVLRPLTAGGFRSMMALS